MDKKVEHDNGSYSVLVNCHGCGRPCYRLYSLLGKEIGGPYCIDCAQKFHPPNRFSVEEPKECSRCHGTGRVCGYKCVSCNGTGK